LQAGTIQSLKAQKGKAMTKTLRAIFDGEVLRPEEPVDLQPNTRYVVTIEREEQDKTSDQPDYPLTQLRRLAPDMGVTDLSTRHSWYAHGHIEDDTLGT
jgi:predicted DNA-binding antitoxin AbrB/MazE fold protein